MTKDPEIVFRNIERSPAIEAAVQERIDRLAERHRDIIGLTATVDAPHRQHHKGTLYTVSVDISVPGDEIVVNRDSGKDHSHEDVYVAIRDSFDVAERQVRNYFEKLRDHRSH